MYLLAGLRLKGLNLSKGEEIPEEEKKKSRDKKMTDAKTERGQLVGLVFE